MLVLESSAIRLLFAMGKIQGSQCMRSHIVVHRATTKDFSKSFVFKTEIEKEGVPRGGTPVLGAGGLRFKSGRPDQSFLRLAGPEFSILREGLPATQMGTHKIPNGLRAEKEGCSRRMEL